MKKVGKTINFIAISVFVVAVSSKAYVVDFEEENLGIFDPRKWSVTHDNQTGQTNLWQVVAAGRDGSKGATVSKKAEHSNSLIYRKGVTGTNFVVSADFKITINKDIPQKHNDEIFSICLSESPYPNEGNRQFMAFVRRDEGKRIGILTDSYRPEGWIRNSAIGLPDILPENDELHTSNWFTMSMQYSDNGDDSWTVIGTIKNEGGAILISERCYARRPSGIKTFYPSASVDYTLKPFLQGGVEALYLDNLSIHTVDK